MFLPFVLLIAIVFFVVQLMLCFKGNNIWIKLSILMIGVAAEVILCFCFLVSPDPMMNRGMTFTAYILAAIGMIWIAALLFAWGIYAIVKSVQKRRK